VAGGLIPPTGTTGTDRDDFKKVPPPRDSLAGQQGGTGRDRPPIGASHRPTPARPLVSDPEQRPTWETDQDAFDFEERAAIREYEGGLSRPAAERLARLDLIDQRRLKTGDRAA